MLLKPPVSEDAALEWLKARAAEAWGVEITPEIEKNLQATAQSMSRISAIELPEEVEPLLI